MSVEFRIMAVLERREKYILPMLEKLGMSEDIVFYDDKAQDKQAMRNARRTWLVPTDKDFVCVLQDDLLLCDNFPEIVEECSRRFPTAIFSFYQPRLKWEDKTSETPYIKIIGCGMYGQAIMIPSNIVQAVFFWSDKNFGVDYPHDDTVIGFFASTNNIPVMATIPCLVQHLGHNDSVLGYNNKNKVSRVFCETPNIKEFETNIFTVSRRIPNTEIVPKGGYKCGKLKKLTELL